MLKNECKKEAAQHPSTSRRAREREADGPQEVGREGHLPGYVSVTSKKEERRDTWSESDKSVRQHTYTAGEKERSPVWLWHEQDDRGNEVFMMGEAAPAVSSFKPLTAWRRRCCCIYCCKWEYFKKSWRKDATPL